MFTFKLPPKKKVLLTQQSLQTSIDFTEHETCGGTKVCTCLWADKLMTFREIADSMVQWHCWKATPRNVAPKSGNPLKRWMFLPPHHPPHNVLDCFQKWTVKLKWKLS